MKQLKLRGLKTSDIYKTSKILKKMGIKPESGEGKTQQQVGAELIITVFESLHLAEQEVNELLGSLVGLTPEEFSELPLEKTMEIIKEFRQLPGLPTFFKPAGQ
jgi:hypothetical protein